MIVESYIPEKHFPMISKWSSAYGWDLVSSDWLPKYGAIVPDVAACFLYRTDSSVAHADCLIANPLATPSDKDLGLKAVINAVCDKAKEDGFKSVIGHSFVPGIVRRCEGSGFELQRNKDFKLIKRL